MKSLTIGIILFITFVVAFFVTTIFFDTIERHTGYYDQGIQDSNSISEKYSCLNCNVTPLCISRFQISHVHLNSNGLGNKIWLANQWITLEGKECK